MRYRGPSDVVDDVHGHALIIRSAGRRVTQPGDGCRIKRGEMLMAKTGRDLVEAARQAVPKMPNDQLAQHLASGRPVVVLDVREKDEWDEGHIPEATLLPRGRLEGRVEQVVPDKTTLVVTH
jgi:hypothetical protein